MTNVRKFGVHRGGHGKKKFTCSSGKERDCINSVSAPVATVESTEQAETEGRQNADAVCEALHC
jgi:hypothetical protein